ncbi:MAG TPA: polysaccharide biosynthesis tyrosine autokinase [Pyrinomonadaceae bacterium]|nr:polysaccharide biosynthesis tyrosine autokinase [Pyrinomonadaceae bacterium]
MTQDERLLPVRPGRDADTSLAEIAHGRGYGKYSRYGNQIAETNVREYLHIVLKRKWLILSLVLVITSLVTIQAYREPSIYQGSSTIRIEAKQGSILQTGGGLVINPTDPNFWGTQLRLLQSPVLARQVVLTLDLPNNPDFLGGQANGGVFSSLNRLLGRERTKPGKAQGQNTDADPVGENEMQLRQLTAEQLAALEPYEDAIVAGQVITPIEKTNLVVINYTHTNPQLAKQIADTLAEVFVHNNLERQELGMSKAELALAQQIATFQEKVKTERDQRFNFAKSNNLPLGPTSIDLEKERERGYSQQLLDAENRRRNLEAAYNAAKTADDPFTNPAVQQDEYIRKLRDKLSDLKEKREALLQIYTPEWPEVRKIDAQIKSTEADLKKAPVQVLASMKRNFEAAQAQERSLIRAYEGQHGKTTTRTKAEIDLAAMTQQLATDEQYLNTLLQKQRELNATSGDGGTNVSIAQMSRVPQAPVGPARLRTIIIAFLLSLMAGVGLAFLLDFLDDTVKSLDDIDRYVHLPALALIPAARSEKGRLTAAEAAAQSPNASTALAMVNDVRSPMAEAYRHLRTSLLLSSAGTPPKTILVTSSQPSEGKTTTAVNTAFMLAQTGAQVLIIDCDLRRPRLHANFNLSNARGLTNFLSGECPIDDVLQSYEGIANLKLLTSGPVPPNPAELLGSEEMRKLLSSLTERFAHVIVDSPPAISFTDASILSTFVDGVILVVHGGRSSRAVVRRAKQQLLDVGANIFGVVLNNVKADSHEYYGAGYSAYYQSEYYTSEDEGDESAAASAR